MIVFAIVVNVGKNSQFAFKLMDTYNWNLSYVCHYISQSEYIGLTVYDLMLEEDHNVVRKKISEAEAKSLTRTTKLGKDKYQVHTITMCVQL